VNITPTGQISPLGAKFTPRGEVLPRGPGVKLRMALCAVKIYNATSSLVYFENKNTFFLLRKNALAYYSAGVVVVNSKS
jgi:hypothetical protein